MSSGTILEKYTAQGRTRPHQYAKRFVPGDRYLNTKKILLERGLATVCGKAGCPNISECWNNGDVTFLILGETCTRSCTFCAVNKGNPGALDPEEPRRIARYIKDTGMRYAVITSVTRDDLRDGGLGAFALTVNEIKKLSDCAIELLTPDFRGVALAPEVISSLGISVFGHDVEMASRLYPLHRPSADYKASLSLLRDVKRKSQGKTFVKSSFMVGLGETDEEALRLIEDLAFVGCDIITIGQYLRPDNTCAPLRRFVSEEKFSFYREHALQKGIKCVLSEPFARSSYRAYELYQFMLRRQND